MPGTAGTTCRAILAEATAWLEGALTPEERERFEAHRAACASCRRELAALEGLIGSLDRLEEGERGASGADKARLVALFREHGHHRGGSRAPAIPLGLGDGRAAPGDHLACFWETEREFAATAGFVAAGADLGESSVILCHDEARARFANALEGLGFDPRVLQRQRRLTFVSSAQSAGALLQATDEQVRTAVDAGAPLVRVLGILGWRQRGSPEDAELVALEARMTDAVRKLPVVVACTYEVRRLPGDILLEAGLECHPFVFRRGHLRRNDLYVPAATFLSDRP
jgi:hypothetical protein